MQMSEKSRNNNNSDNPLTGRRIDAGNKCKKQLASGCFKIVPQMSLNGTHVHNSQSGQNSLLSWVADTLRQ